MNQGLAAQDNWRGRFLMGWMMSETRADLVRVVWTDPQTGAQMQGDPATPSAVAEWEARTQADMPFLKYEIVALNRA
jgi:hypothetical protein